MRWPAWLKLALLLAALGGLLWVGRTLELSPERVRDVMFRFGLWAPVIYLLAYSQPLVPLPASVMTPTAGLAFGPAWGFAAALTGASLRAVAEFGIARLLGRRAVERLVKGRVRSLDDRLGQNTFKAVLLIRLIPNLPFDVQNYGLGFSRAKFGPYALATVLGMVPGGFAYVYLGYSLTDPQHLWKLGLAILLVVAVIVGQQLWKKRQGRPAQESP